MAGDFLWSVQQTTIAVSSTWKSIGNSTGKSRNIWENHGKTPINGDFNGNIIELNANIIEFNGGFSIARLDFRRICGVRPLRARKMRLFNIH